jgi:prepilin-type N-terminal cleavage/methylation domain-containing protein
MKYFRVRLKSGFTLMELMVALGIVALLVAIVLTNLTQAKSRGRDSQVRADIGKIRLALVKVRESNPLYHYPGTAGAYQCIKTTGTCFKGQYSANTTLTSAISSYFPGQAIPKPPGTNTSENRHDAYVLNPYLPAATPLPNGQYGPVLIWYQEKPIPDCKGYVAQHETGIYYCYEQLPY